MKPIMQTITTVPGGDCFRACVASILEMPIVVVPHFCDTSEANWLAGLLRWLKPQGLYPVYVTPWERVQKDLGSPIAGHCILGVRTDPPTSAKHPEWLHAVVGEAVINPDNTVNFTVVHDPNPKRRKIAAFTDVLWIVRNAEPQVTP